MAPDRAAKQVENFLGDAPVDGGPRSRESRCISFRKVAEPDAETGRLPNPWAGKVAQFERNRSAFTTLFADANEACANCGGTAYTTEPPREADLYDVTCCMTVEVHDLR